MKHNKFVSAVIYIHDNGDGITDFLQMLYKELNNNFASFEIICVNDCSSDNSVQAIRDFSQTVSNCVISLVNTGYYQGIEQVMFAGLDLAIGDFVFEFDEITVDYEPNMIMQCYNKCIQGFDIVSCGSGGGRSSSKVFYRIFNRYSETQYNLYSETFRIISRRAVNRVSSMSFNPIYRKALYNSCGFKTIYIQYDKKSASQGRRVLKNQYDTALTGLVLFTDVAYRAAAALTIFMMAAAVGTFSYITVVYIKGDPAEGYTTIMAFLSVAFFGISAILAIIVKYLSVLVRLVYRRQKYVFESIEKL